MSPAPRPEPAAAQRVKELARDASHAAKELADGAAGAAKDLARDLAAGYRRSTRYFRMRAAVVATWAALSIATLWAACPSSGPRNGLGAEATLSDAFLGAQVLVRNESDALWRDVVFTLDGGWKLERRTVRPRESVPLSVTQFRKGDEVPPRDLKPRTLTIECSEGEATLALGGR